jgi:hypothetical protein
MKALDSWARQYGVSDWDTYIRSGGSILDAAGDIAQRIRRLQDALKALPVDPRYLDQRAPYLAEPVINPEALARLETEPHDEPPDPENAQIQGAEHGEP